MVRGTRDANADPAEAGDGCLPVLGADVGSEDRHHLARRLVDHRRETGNPNAPAIASGPSVAAAFVAKTPRMTSDASE